MTASGAGARGGVREDHRERCGDWRPASSGFQFHPPLQSVAELNSVRSVYGGGPVGGEANERFEILSLSRRATVSFVPLLGGAPL